MKAVKCPVCDGKGQIVNCFGEGGSYQEVDCHGCQGKGWVEVGAPDIKFDPSIAR
ncbi:hypothetical protein LCGC14_3133720 [marine sediment metagenome]|uniref:CR-type domain-containing protein n=1 Tax=marine sediment metagenome TaxID=412755 RepID=A0A0F8Y5Y2_9ZZZZ